MSSTASTDAVLTTQDGVPLKVSIARAVRRRKIRAFLLVVPLLLFIVLTFVMPIMDMLYRSVENDIVSETLPETVVALKSWDQDSGQLPDEAVFAALAADMKVAAEQKTHTRARFPPQLRKAGHVQPFPHDRPQGQAV